MWPRFFSLDIKLYKSDQYSINLIFLMNKATLGFFNFLFVFLRQNSKLSAVRHYLFIIGSLTSQNWILKMKSVFILSENSKIHSLKYFIIFSPYYCFHFRFQFVFKFRKLKRFRIWFSRQCKVFFSNINTKTTLYFINIAQTFSLNISLHWLFKMEKAPFLTNLKNLFKLF